MKYRLLAMLLGLAGLFAADMSVAAIVDVRATPRQATLVASGGNLVSIRWAVAASPDHSSGVTSTGASIVDPSSGTILQRVTTTLNGAGAGPFMLREVLNLDAVTVRAWTDAGLRRVVLQRSFADPATGAFVDATVVLNLSASRLQATREAAPGELVITSLQLEFETGNNAAVVGPAESLQAILTVQHTGNGILRGRWQIAEPGSSEGAPLFRTLVLVNANVRSGQRSIYLSPTLPTGRPGVYVLRFCASEPNNAATSDDVLCPDADRVVTATYQVQLRDGETGTGIRGLAPDRAVASGASSFRWEAVPAARLYQLQIFALAPDVADAEHVNGGARQPRFVTGMLVRGDSAETRLSDLVLSRLQAGQRYLWRITAHDESGRVTASSAEASFIYAPGT
jgi:hypothetical protein